MLAQSVFGYRGVTVQINEFYKIQNVAGISCESCDVEHIGTMGPVWQDGVTMSPEGDLYTLNSDIFITDTLTGNTVFFYALPNWPEFPWAQGFISTGGGVFYTISYDHPDYPGDSLLQINTNTGVITNLGFCNWACTGEMAKFNSEFYYITSVSSVPAQRGIVKLDINNPANNELVVTCPLNVRIEGLTATKFCNTLLATEYFSSKLVYINLIDESIIPVCDMPQNLELITSILEFEIPTICEVTLDLDCNDSSGATDADFNAEEFNCLSGPISITDNDIGMFYDAIIEEMTIEITGSIPDDPFEVLNSTGNTQNIDVSGSGTDMISLTNAGGAKSTDFKDALRLIRYDNTALVPTAGVRTVEVQFSTESGSMSNVATAFIEVIELPLVAVNLGLDQEICEGESATFDAGNPGANYEWSTGANTQTITVDDEDEYIVTVSDDINCPNQDTVELTLLPVVHVALEGQFQTCDNVPLTLTINTDSPFPLTVEISATPGSPFVLNNVIGLFSFNDLPTEETEYTITLVTSSQPACIEVTDPTQLVDVYPSYVHLFDASICEGDSIWLGFYWETEPGVYQNTFNTFDGCDSVVTTTLTVSPAINIAQQSGTCDSAEVGVFVENLINPNGCDTVITTTVSLLPSDTTHLSLSSCRLSDAGVFTQSLTNQQGCDSLVITTTIYDPPADTTAILLTTCDSSVLGVFQQTLSDVGGCDSLIITTIHYSSTDTTYQSGVSCDPTQIGTTQNLFTTPEGCDSLVITTIVEGIPDTTYAFATSCDSTDLGIEETYFVNQAGCDSIVFTTITYSVSDSVFLQSTSCDPTQAGVFVNAYINRFGCDSIVTSIVSLLPSAEVFLQAASCDESETGIFTDTLTNMHGCDSVVITTVDLLPSDETTLFGSTCRSSEAGVFISNSVNQFGCDSVITLTVELIPADTTLLLHKTCKPEEVGTVQNSYTNQDGCDSLVIEQTELHPLPQLDLQVTSDFNGYAISCFGESDGSAHAQVNGVPLFEYLWSTTETSQSISGLIAGDYGVTVTDGNGCTASGEVTLTQPEEFSIGFRVTHPDCFDADKGVILVEQTGGVDPVKYTIDGVNYQSSAVFEGLTGGTYEITAIDANECEVKEILWINVPLMVNVELGDDMQLFPGDAAVLNAIVNVPFDSLAAVQWNGLLNPGCPECLTQVVAPIITTTYSVSVSTYDGCTDEDAMTLFLETNNGVYVPNIFSPDGDGVNDVIIISAGSSVEEILEFTVFDRWGDVVYADDHFMANDGAHGWDGRMKGKELNPGVFAYKMIVEFVDGTQDVVVGDITLLK